MKLTLAQISEEFYKLYKTLEENEGEITPEIEEQLALTEKNFSSKIEDYMVFIETLEKDEAVYKNHIETLRAKVKTIEKNKLYLTEIVKEALKRFGTEEKTEKGLPKYKVIVNDSQISLSPSQAVEIVNEEIIPNSYKEFVLQSHKLNEKDYNKLQKVLKKHLSLFSTDISVPKKVIKENINEGKDIPGARLTTNFSLKRALKPVKK